MSRYWQHNSPLKCPQGHEMVWLGSRFWICGKGKCNTIYVDHSSEALAGGQKAAQVSAPTSDCATGHPSQTEEK